MAAWYPCSPIFFAGFAKGVDRQHNSKRFYSIVFTNEISHLLILAMIVVAWDTRMKFLLQRILLIIISAYTNVLALSMQILFPSDLTEKKGAAIID